ncbi:helix-turn-helix domain-containing protein [Chitinophaga barathri]|uniref:AraC family transcriptional regulator n=1 Tax=Chitinophaga barathri TaxID=1647451 RepID=A0A3N4M6G8_9BACT|nr:AraC family transcriptional regulator [Chitinophaga barathri]RPD38715.1 AraC family transcriptional regulator [Chitinophaga barathri]
MTPKTQRDALNAIANHAFFKDHATLFTKEQTSDNELWDPLQALMHFQVTAAGTQRISIVDAERLQAVKDYLRTEYLCPELSLGLICRRFGLNEFKLKRGFKQLFGNTVFGFVQEMKMKAARRMLVEKRLNVNEVADHLGYSSPNHFSAAFKKMFGYPPAKLKAFIVVA